MLTISDFQTIGVVLYFFFKGQGTLETQVTREQVLNLYFYNPHFTTALFVTFCENITDT